MDIAKLNEPMVALVDETAISRYLTDTFADVTVTEVSGDSFFFYDPERKFPFATLITQDNAFDNVSNLNRPGVFRLNVGVSKQTFQSLFASHTGEYDLTALDQLMPHPTYGKMYWVSVLNPGPATFQTVQTLLAEAYKMSVKKHPR